MIKGYIDTYKQIELIFEHKVNQQINNFATHSPHYSKDALKHNMLMLRYAKGLKAKMIEANTRWAAEREQQRKQSV